MMMMPPFPGGPPTFPSPGGTTWSAENAQGEERVRISVIAKEKLKFWPTEAVVQYRLREQGAQAKPLLAKLEDQTERFRRAVEAIDLALAGQPHDDEDDDKPPGKTGDDARAAYAEALSPSMPRTTTLPFPNNVPPWINIPPPPWATNAPTPTRTPTRTPTATRDTGDDERDADEDLNGRGSGGGGQAYWGSASGSYSPPPFFPLSNQSNPPLASVLSAGGGAAADLGSRFTPKRERPLSLKELCEGLVVSAVALDNVMDVLSAVGRHSDAVKEHCLKFIGRNLSRARKVEEIRAALEGTAEHEWSGAAVRRHIENAPRVRVEAVVLGPKEKDNNAIPIYGQHNVQTPGFSAYRDCYVVIPLPPRAANEAAGPTDDAEAALEANRRVTGVIDSLLRHSFLPHQLAQNHLSFSYSSAQTVVKFVSHAQTEPLPAEVMKRLREKAHSIALTQATAQGLGKLRLRNTNVYGHVQRKVTSDLRGPMEIAVGLSSPAYASIVYLAQLHAMFEVTPTEP